MWQRHQSKTSNTKHCVYDTSLKWQIYSTPRLCAPSPSLPNHPPRDRGVVIGLKIRPWSVSGIVVVVSVFVSVVISIVVVRHFTVLFFRYRGQACIVKPLLSVCHKLLFYFRSPIISQYFRILKYHWSNDIICCMCHKLQHCTCTWIN